MANTYTPQTWTDGVSSASAARMGVIETGVQGAWARELNYTQFTANVSVTATTEATANTIVTASAVSFDGSTAAIIEFAATANPDPTAASRTLSFWLYQDGSSIGQLGFLITPAAAQMAVPVRLARRMTPASGSRTFSIRASVSAGTGTVFAGVGGAGLTMPGFILITRA